MKLCRKCKNEIKILTRYSRSICLDCLRKSWREQYRKTYNSINEKERNKKRKDWQKLWYIKIGNDRKKNLKVRLKYLAQQEANRVIKKGELKKGKCKLCKSIKVEVHHEDYTKPLKVIWLCRKCHSFIHRKD